VEIDVDVSLYSNLQVVCFDVCYPGGKVRIFVVYGPLYYDVVALQYMEDLMKYLTITKYITTKYGSLTVGDFNCPRD